MMISTQMRTQTRWSRPTPAAGGRRRHGREPQRPCAPPPPRPRQPRSRARSDDAARGARARSRPTSAQQTPTPAHSPRSLRPGPGPRARPAAPHPAWGAPRTPRWWRPAHRLAGTAAACAASQNHPAPRTPPPDPPHSTHPCQAPRHRGGPAPSPGDPARSPAVRARPPTRSTKRTPTRQRAMKVAVAVMEAATPANGSKPPRRSPPHPPNSHPPLRYGARGAQPTRRPLRQQPRPPPRA